MDNPIYDIPFSNSHLEDITGISKLSLLDKGESIPKYTGFIDDQKIVLRYLASNKVVSDRFVREGQALLLLNKKCIQLETNGFTVPKIIAEWPEHQLRAITYLEGIEGYLLSEDEIRLYVDSFQAIEFNHRFDFKHGIFSNLSQTDGIDKELVETYESIRDQVVDTFEWPSYSHNLIHGDFHVGNLLKTDDGLIGILDWEYASSGSIYFDLAYYQSMSDTSVVLPKELKEFIEPWKIYVLLVLTHWYLVYYPNDIPQGQHWLDKLRKAVRASAI